MSDNSSIPYNSSRVVVVLCAVSTSWGPDFHEEYTFRVNHAYAHTYILLILMSRLNFPDSPTYIFHNDEIYWSNQSTQKEGHSTWNLSVWTNKKQR